MSTELISTEVSGEVVREHAADNCPLSLLTRRRLFQVLGSGLLMLVVSDEADAQESGRRGGRGGGQGPRDIGAWLHISESGRVTVYTGKTEVGQNIRTSLSQAAAEELSVPLDTVELLMADTDLTPYDMGTFGSRTTPTMSPQLRRAAAGAREAVIDLAAALWQVDRSGLTAADGVITDRTSRRSIAYGALVKGQRLTQTIADESALKRPDQWTVSGKPTSKVDGKAFVTGSHRYSSDTRRDGMLFGKVLRPPAFGATLKSVDVTAAAALPGVNVVHKGDFVGVTARSVTDAERAISLIHAEWQEQPQVGEKDLFATLRPGGAALPTAGGRKPAEAGRDGSIDAVYGISYIAHCPLEPRAAAAEWTGDKVTVWTGTQRPFGVKGDLATALGIPEAQVRVIVPDTGSAYGGKHTGEAAVEAALLARAAGAPVKLIWTRQEEFTWAYFRPAGVIAISSTLSANGAISRWEMDNYLSGPSGIRSPYDVPGQRAEYHGAASPLRQGSYRGLASTANHFARESHMDDLALAAKTDPLAFRLKNCRDDRLRAVLKAATDRFKWESRSRSPNRGFGLAVGTEKDSYVAHCVELTVDRAARAVKLERIIVAFECGAIVNPLHLENQVEGATVMGIGGALFEAIHFDEGRILNAHMAAYRVPRFHDAPHIDVVLIDRKDIPSAGAGETPISTIAPAIGNAILDATGLRFGNLPMLPNGLPA